MKKLLVFLFSIFVCTIAIAHTINWHVGDTIIQTTTCDSGNSITPPTAPDKYGYTFKAWGNYQQLEYIQSTGGQYIDTGITGECTLLLTAQGIEPTTTDAQIVAGVSPSTAVTWFGKWGDNNKWSGSSIDYTTKVDAVIHFKDAPVTITVNDKTYTEYTGKYNNTNKMYLFSFNRQYGAKVKIFRATFIQNGLIIKDFIPVHRVQDNVLGMYDAVNGQFFTNAGTGNFIAGPAIGTLGAE